MKEKEKTKRGKVQNALRLAFSLVLFAFTAVTARADYYVQWAVNPGEEFADFAGAMVAVKADGYTGWLMCPDINVRSYELFAEASALTGGMNAIGYLDATGSLDGYEFQVLLFDATDRLIAQNNWTAAGEIKDSDGAWAISQVMTPSTGVWEATNFAAVPEPTTGLLMLFGLAGLALRRRK